MLVKNDLALIESYLSEVIHTPYFDSETLDYVNGLLAIVRNVIANHTSYPPDFLLGLRGLLWASSKYLSGTTSREVPYEAVFALRKALREWTTDDFIITTALLEDLEYHFFGLDALQVLRNIIPSLVPASLNKLLVQMALPKLYRNRPLYSVALYHELGHFIDSHRGVIKMSLLLRPAVANPKYEQMHRAEHFCDLLAASYVGTAMCKLLKHIAPNDHASSSHPATVDRISLIETFLAGQHVTMIDLLQDALTNLKIPALEVRFSEPDISACFQNIRPYDIKNERELHGILPAAWSFLEKIAPRNALPWLSFNDDESIVNMINDLVEKSIRNYSIKEKWNATAGP
jgi:hypothetical protein